MSEGSESGVVTSDDCVAVRWDSAVFPLLGGAGRVARVYDKLRQNFSAPWPAPLEGESYALFF